MNITKHAVSRYRSRVANVTDAQAIAALDSPAVQTAASFGARYVRLGTGQRIVIEGDTVVTVLPATAHPGTLSRASDPVMTSAGKGAR